MSASSSFYAGFKVESIQSQSHRAGLRGASQARTTSGQTLAVSDEFGEGPQRRRRLTHTPMHSPPNPTPPLHPRRVCASASFLAGWSLSLCCRCRRRGPRPSDDAHTHTQAHTRHSFLPPPHKHPTTNTGKQARLQARLSPPSTHTHGVKGDETSTNPSKADGRDAAPCAGRGGHSGACVRAGVSNGEVRGGEGGCRPLSLLCAQEEGSSSFHRPNPTFPTRAHNRG